MAYGRISYTRSLPLGKTNPVALGTAAVRAAAKAGLGGSTKAKPSPVDDPAMGKALAAALGIPPAKKTSTGRQNVKVALPKGLPDAKPASKQTGSRTRGRGKPKAGY